MREIRKVRERYARRKQMQEKSLYNFLNPDVYMGGQEKERMLIHFIKRSNLLPLQDKRLLVIGCGGGGNILQLIRLGFKPENIVGSELLEDRAEKARYLLPASTEIITGDATKLNLKQNSFDIVFQSTVFSSILDDDFQRELAERMWSFVKSNGGVLWYDFVFNNPKNPDVKGVSIRRVQELFPKGTLKTWRLTLAPPISRRVTKFHSSLYTLFNFFPFLRTHVLCWIKKV